MPERYNFVTENIDDRQKAESVMEEIGRVYPECPAIVGEMGQEVIKLGEYTWHIANAFPVPAGLK